MSSVRAISLAILVVIMAFFLFICDKLIEWGLYDFLLRLSL